MIRVLVAEDSPTLREFLVHILSAEADIRVIATAVDGVQAAEAVARLRPDVVTMDIHMPRLDGFAATRRIMEDHPTPIVIVSSTMSDQVAATFRAIEAGALAFVRRPHGIGHREHAADAGELVQTVRLMAEVKVVRRWRKSSIGSRRIAPTAASVGAGAKGRIVAIGASTGGPIALQTLLKGLPSDFSAPLVIVQHISPGFVEGFVDWLGGASSLPVRLAQHGEPLLPGHVYLAPDGSHMGVTADAIRLDTGHAENGSRPAISYLFRSVAESFGANAAGILLSGMGADGAAELKALRELGATTVAQSKESSVVHGIPGVAIDLGAAGHVLDPVEISKLLTRWAS
ncbi:chemotaxis response regulator protein-glutamate methylesterase [Aliidongia dinghuensis]|uniref:Protein-glutamate methylesterase/protein-glutamine glutaminase n=1 Tax=Aliidongia dinghuensis TaxID=1867774 RepID=A0A8J2YSS2_9PROT|nr:chemotaxis response regulator protein-glutamate methylesterase [Aliidongia dinghuensis]